MSAFSKVFQENNQNISKQGIGLINVLHPCNGMCAVIKNDILETFI